jgi:hypothetical protein
MFMSLAAHHLLINDNLNNASFHQNDPLATQNCIRIGYLETATTFDFHLDDSA